MEDASPVEPGSAIHHGTNAGQQWHIRSRTPVCEPCRAARAAYMKQWWQRNPEARKRNNAKNNARTRALWRLAHLHPLEFKALMQEEIQKAVPL